MLYTKTIALDEVELKIGNSVLPMGASDLFATVDISQPDSRYPEDTDFDVREVWFGAEKKSKHTEVLDPKEHGFLYDAALQHAESMEAQLMTEAYEAAADNAADYADLKIRIQREDA